MSEVQATATVPSTETAPASTQLTSAQLLAQINADIAAMSDSGDSSDFSELSASEADSTEATQTEEPAVEEKAAAEEPPKEAEASTLSKLAIATQKLQRLEAQELAHKQRADTAENQLKELKTALQARDDGDIFAEFERRGTTWRDFLEKISKGDLSPPEAKAKAPVDPELEALKAEWKATKDKQAKDAHQTQFEALRKQDVQEINAFITESEHSFLKALPDSGDTIVSAFYDAMQGRKQDEAGDVLQKVVTAAEANVKRQVEALLGSDAVIDLITRSPELHAKISKVVPRATEQTKANPGKPIDGTQVAGDKPTTLTNALTNVVPSRTEKRHLSAADIAREVNLELSGR